MSTRETCKSRRFSLIRLFVFFAHRFSSLAKDLANALDRNLYEGTLRLHVARVQKMDGPSRKKKGRPQLISSPVYPNFSKIVYLQGGEGMRGCAALYCSSVTP